MRGMRAGIGCVMSVGMVLGLLARLSSGQTCEPRWLAGEGEGDLEEHGSVWASTVWDPDGPGPQLEMLVFGGGFNFPRAVGSFPSNHIVPVAAWDGSRWQLFDDENPDSASLLSHANALTVYNGAVIAAGYFVTEGSVAANVARWDGSAWRPVGTGFSASISALTVYNGELIAAGQFWTSGYLNIARWDGSTWRPLDGGVSGGVNALAVYNGELIVSGTFRYASGVPAAGLARWNGSAWQPLSGGAETSGSPLALYHDELIADVRRTVDGVVVTGLAAWNGSSWRPLQGAVRAVGTSALTVCNGELYAAGWFYPGGGGSGRVARWDGSDWQFLGGSIPGITPTVRTLTEYNYDLYAAGAFRAIGDANINHIARWDGSGWVPPGKAMNNEVHALLVYKGEMIAAGDFTAASGAAANRIARWDGSAWHPLGSGLGPASAPSTPAVSALTVYDDELIVGGGFTVAGDVPANKIAAWNGSSWRALGDGMDHGEVNTLAVYEGELVAGGWFSMPGGVDLNGIARWDGRSWQALGPGVDGIVYALTVYDDELIVGGYFRTAGGVSACSIAAWNGSTWRSLGVEGDQGSVLALTVYNGDLIAAGWIYVGAGGQSGPVARWDGSTWRALATDLYWMLEPYVLAVYNGALIAGGDYGYGQLAWWDGSGTWQDLGGGVEGSPYHSTEYGSGGYRLPRVSALAVHNGELFVGGRFGTAGGQPSAYVARWLEPVLPTVTHQPVPQSVVAGDTATFTVVTTGTEPVSYQWRKDGVDLVDGGDVAGASAATLTISPVGGADAGQYEVAVSNECGSVNSDAAALTVCEPAVVTDQPIAQSVIVGEAATFAVAAEGTEPLAYQWRKDGLDLVDSGSVSGATTSTLTVAAKAMTDSGRYEAMVMNQCGLATSAAAELTVLPVPAFVDIRPLACPNQVVVNPRSRGLLPVAIVGSSTFDVKQVNVKQISMNGQIVPVHVARPFDLTSPTDTTDCSCSVGRPDRIRDLVVYFSLEDVIEGLGLESMVNGAKVPVTVEGVLGDGRPFAGIDCVTVKVLKKRKLPK